jgi:hypothetical protein
MADANQTRALKASFRGALDASASLAAIRERIEGLDDHADLDMSLLEELARLTGAHAVASAALRGLVEAIRAGGSSTG